MRYGPDLREESIAIMYRPNFDALPSGEEIDLHAGRRNRLPRGRNPQELAAMGSVEREAVSDLFTLRNNVLNLRLQIGETFQKTGVMLPQPPYTGPDAAGIAMVDNRIAIEREIPVEILQSKATDGLL